MQEARNRAALDGTRRNGRNSGHEHRPALRAALQQYAMRVGFGRQAVELVINAARIEALETGALIDSRSEGSPGLGFVISGVARVVYSIRKAREVTLLFVPPG